MLTHHVPEARLRTLKENMSSGAIEYGLEGIPRVPIQSGFFCTVVQRAGRC
jgi:hypothetical protein